MYQFEGDRTREEIVAFAQRLMGPAVRTISSADELRKTVNKREIAFAFIGEPEGRLWVRKRLIVTCQWQQISSEGKFISRAPLSTSQLCTNNTSSSFKSQRPSRKR